MREQDQHEAILAFWVAMMAALFALVFPSDGHTVLVREWIADVRLNLARPLSGGTPFDLCFNFLYLGPVLLWLLSPFLSRVYGQSKAVRVLAKVISAIATAATSIAFFFADHRKPSFCAILLAAIAHTIGIFLIKKEHPDQA
ncbi:hypothetical protein [Haloferula sp. BvORR071]|uniref:hypothetical protein n=1 Tax=Haloferula sp. BvORR071 TaxID=1396141 RepID=UPI000551C8B2|nr:hypothetical protein [Haloferula sp. BvORR071]